MQSYHHGNTYDKEENKSLFLSIIKKPQNAKKCKRKWIKETMLVFSEKFCILSYTLFCFFHPLNYVYLSRGKLRFQYGPSVRLM